MARIVSAVAGQLIHLGRAGEHLATTISFDVSDWLAEASQVYPSEYNDGYFTLYVHQTGIGYYEQLISQPGDEAEGQVHWHVTNSNTSIIGMGKCELIYSITSNVPKIIIDGILKNGKDFYVTDVGYISKDGIITDLANDNYVYQDTNTQKIYYVSGYNLLEVHTGNDISEKHLFEDILVKSVIYDIIVTKSLDGPGDVPTPIQSWLDRVHKMTAVVANAEESIYESERWARGKVGGVDVVEGEPGYHDNSKYYSGQAESSADAAEDGAALAKNWAIYNLTPATGVEPGPRNNALYYARVSESYAKGTQDGNAVGSGQPGFEDNALYYKNLAKNYRDYIANSNQATTTTLEPTTQNPTPPARVHITEGTTGLLFNFEIPRGQPGAGLIVSGTVPTNASLPAASSTSVGTAYGVGPGLPTAYDIYICTYTDTSGSSKTWTNFGSSMAGIAATRYDWS